MENNITLIKELYKPGDPFIFNYVIPIGVIIMWLYYMFYYMIQIELSVLKKMPKNNCSSKYLFVSGFIQKDYDESILASTKNNFKKCVKLLS